VDPAALLVALVVGLFRKLSDRGGDRIADALTDAAAAKVRELLAVLRERLGAEDPTETTLAELQRDPASEGLERVLTAQITRLLAEDQSLNHRLTDLLRQVLADNRGLAEALAQRTAAAGAHAESHGEGNAIAVNESTGTRIIIGDDIRVVEIREADRPAATPQELPPDPRYFTGRSALTSSLVHELRPRENAVPRVSITGEPGVGKTGLALHVAHALRRAHYAEVQLFIRLSTGGELPLPAADALYDALVALDVPRDRIPAGAEARRRRYLSELAGKAALVVLDDAVDAEQVDALLPPAGCAMIVTSRDELLEVLADEVRAVRLQPLSLQDAVRYLARRIGPDRVARELSGAVRIANACDRLPLALSIVAAQLNAESGKHLRLNEVSWRLSYERTRVEQLTAGRRSVPAALARRYRTLTDRQRELFLVLGVCNAADLDVGLVAAALGRAEEEAATRVAELVDAGLLEEVGRGRWRMHDLIRLYARGVAEDVPVEQRQAILGRLAAYYAQRLGALAELADGARSGRIDPARLERGLLWLDRERPTLVVLVEQLASEHVSLLADLLLDLATVAADALTCWPEMPRLSRTMLAVAQRERDDRLRAWALYHQALDLARRGATDKARELLGQAWSLATRTSDQGLRNRLGHALHTTVGTSEPPPTARPSAQPSARPAVPDGRVEKPAAADPAAADPAAADRRSRRPPPASPLGAGAADLPRTISPEPVRGAAPAGHPEPEAARSAGWRNGSERLDRWAILSPPPPAGPSGRPGWQAPSGGPSNDPGPSNGPGTSDGHRPRGGPGSSGGSGPSGPSGGRPSGGSGHRRGGGRRNRRTAAGPAAEPRPNQVRQATETVRGTGAAPSTPMIFG
jgi:hypothetical protein